MTDTQTKKNGFGSVKAVLQQANKATLFPLERIHGKIPPLLTGDIIVIRHKKGGLARALLRRLTNSYWDHTALVIFTRSSMHGYASDIIVESIQESWSKSIHHGAEIHRLEKYLLEPDKYDIGIKRFTWLKKPQRRRVRAFVLTNIDTPYYPLVSLKLALGLVSNAFRGWILERQRFSCSGLVQKAFYEAVDWKDRSRVIFRNVGYTPIQLQDITSPGDIAKSVKCKWIYNAHD